MHLLEEKLVITKDDLVTINEFFKYFKVKRPSYLKKAMKEFAKEQTLATQVQLVIALTQAISVDHPISQLDEVFQPMIEEISKTMFELSFNKEIDDTLTDKNK